MNDNIRYWLALQLAPEIGTRRFLQILEQGGDPSVPFNTPTLAWVRQLPAATQAYLRAPDWTAVDAALAWQSSAADHHILTLHDSAYPPRLRETADPPPLLFVEGNVSCLLDPQLAMVGSRQMTPYGRDIAFAFAKALSQMGLTITSGLAAGIDAQSHRGALASTGASTGAGAGHTIAVLGTGLDIIYPTHHRGLAEQIRAEGCLVSSFPLGTRPDKATFPQRNRIITGLSTGLLVVEAALQSGSLISARLAMEQGRDVFAIPGSIHNSMSKGCHWLLQQGAKLVQSTDDILNELKPHLQAFLQQHSTEPKAAAQPAPTPFDTDRDYQTLLSELSSDPTPFDSLVAATHLSAPVVSSMLLILEMQDRVELTGEGYILIQPDGAAFLTSP